MNERLFAELANIRSDVSDVREYVIELSGNIAWQRRLVLRVAKALGINPDSSSDPPDVTGKLKALTLETAQAKRLNLRIAKQIGAVAIAIVALTAAIREIALALQ